MFQLPDNIWTEEYQLGVLSEHFKAFDNLRKKGWFIGEMIWNFADFRTDQCKYIYIVLIFLEKNIFFRCGQSFYLCLILRLLIDYFIVKEAIVLHFKSWLNWQSSKCKIITNRLCRLKWFTTQTGIKGSGTNANIWLLSNILIFWLFTNIYE